MSSHIIPVSNFVSLFWIISLFILFRLILNRVNPTAFDYEWNYYTKISQIRPRSNLITLTKIYNTVRRSTPREMAMNLRNEFTGNAALAYDKPNAFFVKYRTDREVMGHYFQDQELQNFFVDPKLWAIQNGGVKISLFGLIVNEDKASDEYFDNLARIINKFERQLAGIKKEQIEVT